VPRGNEGLSTTPSIDLIPYSAGTVTATGAAVPTASAPGPGACIRPVACGQVAPRALPHSRRNVDSDHCATALCLYSTPLEFDGLLRVAGNATAELSGRACDKSTAASGSSEPSATFILTARESQRSNGSRTTLQASHPDAAAQKPGTVATPGFPTDDRACPPAACCHSSPHPRDFACGALALSSAPKPP
jgi:hypothetical protein